MKNFTRVKRLGWREDDTNWWVSENRICFLSYEVRKTDRGDIRVKYPNSNWIYFGSDENGLNSAFEACQKDFEYRIESALEKVPD